MNRKVVVIMPHGKHTNLDQNVIDFDAVYQGLIKPALTTLGLTIDRWPDLTLANGLPAELLQVLLTADAVVADLSLGVPSIYYALGIREALRAKGVVTVAALGMQDKEYLLPACHYHLSNGVPDQDSLVGDQQALSALVENLKSAPAGKPTSPIFQQIPKLLEPDWHNLRVVKAASFWQAYQVWESRCHIAAQAGHIGDLLLLSEESPVAQFRAMAYLQAGIALRNANQFEFALTQFDRALVILPEQPTALQEKGICLQQLALQGKSKYPAYTARLHYISMLKDYPDDPNTWAFLGDLDYALWVHIWHKPLRTSQQMREMAAEGESRLRSAIESYRQAFRRNPRFLRAGIKAMTLMHVYQYLTGETRFFLEANAMVGALRYALEFDPHPTHFSQSTLGELEVLAGTSQSVNNAYKAAIAQTPTDWSTLQAALAHLYLLQALDFHPETVMAGIETLEKALVNVNPPAMPWQPRQVILFSGHIIDAPDRAIPRFPPEKSVSAAVRITEALANLGANSDDLALTQGAAGGDILFIEACLQRGVRVQLLQPFAEAEFIERSVISVTHGEGWRARYLALRMQLKLLPRSMPEALGELDGANCNPFERCNRWLLSTALAYGQDRLRFMCLWNGQNSDQTGGTVDLVQAVTQLAVPMLWINSDEL